MTSHCNSVPPDWVPWVWATAAVALLGCVDHGRVPLPAVPGRVALPLGASGARAAPPAAGSEPIVAVDEPLPHEERWESDPAYLPFRRVPLVVVSSDPAHCPVEHRVAFARTALRAAEQCIRFVASGDSWTRLVMAPAADRGGQTYYLCAEPIGRRPVSPKPTLPDEDAPRDDVVMRLRDLPGGVSIAIENAPRWGSADRDDMPLDCSRAVAVPVVRAQAGEVLPTRTPRALSPSGPPGEPAEKPSRVRPGG
jgi:hypothetical protein